MAVDPPPTAAAAATPRVKSILISGYRAFPPYRPDSLTIDLGETGRNLLLHGENGSGKTSLFRCLRDLFDTSPRARDYAECRNIFHQEEDDSIVVRLTSGTPSEFGWEQGEQHPKLTEGQPFQQIARTCVFLDYRDLLKTNFVHHVGTPNLFNLLLGSILADLPVPAQRLGDFNERLTSAIIPSGRQTRTMVRRAASVAEQLSEALRNHLPEVVQETNGILARLQKNTTVELAFRRNIEYSTATRSFTGCNIELEVALNGTDVPAPQHFLNEARLTAIALAMYLAGVRLTRSGRPGIMVLDDVLIGLDVTNRMPLLDVLETDFSDWQVILLTHDAAWFDMASEWLNNDRWTFQRFHAATEPGTGRERPLHSEEADHLLRAKAYLHVGAYPAAGVHLRSKFEALLRDFAEERGLKVPFKRELRELKSEDLWSAVKQWSPRRGVSPLFSPSLIRRIEFCRRFILNPLCHEAAGRPCMVETQIAVAALEEMEQTIKAERDWTAEWQRTKPRGTARPTCWHMSLCESLLSQLPLPPIYCLGMAVREAFSIGLEKFNERHQATISFLANSYATRQVHWDAGKAAGLALSQPAFSTVIDQNSNWLLCEDPDDAIWSAVTEHQIRTVFDSLRNSTTGNSIRCALNTW